MPEHLHYDDDALVNVETHHEKSDVNVRALFIFLVVFLLFALVTHFLILYMFKFFVGIENGRTNDPLTQVQRPVNAEVPASPRLQPFPNRDDRGQVSTPNANTPVADMVEMRANEERELHSYGWIDPARGVARIPIEQAKQLVLQRGLAVTATSTGTGNAAPAATTQAVSTPAAASPAVQAGSEGMRP